MKDLSASACAFKTFLFVSLISAALFSAPCFALTDEEVPVPVQRFPTYGEILWHGNRNLPEVALTF